MAGDGGDQMGQEGSAEAWLGLWGIRALGYQRFGANLEMGWDWQRGDKIADGARRIKGRADKQRVRARENRDHRAVLPVKGGDQRQIIAVMAEAGAQIILTLVIGGKRRCQPRRQQCLIRRTASPLPSRPAQGWPAADSPMRVRVICPCSLLSADMRAWQSAALTA